MRLCSCSEKPLSGLEFHLIGATVIFSNFGVVYPCEAAGYVIIIKASLRRKKRWLDIVKK